MNIERMLNLADQLENPTDPRLRKVTFDMCDFSSGPGHIADAIVCGTAACIGGTACILYGDKLINSLEAARVLDLNHDQARQLFFNYFGYISLEKALFEITPRDAAKAIRRMVDEHVEDDLAWMAVAEELVLA